MSLNPNSPIDIIEGDYVSYKKIRRRLRLAGLKLSVAPAFTKSEIGLVETIKEYASRLTLRVLLKNNFGIWSPERKQR